MTERKKNDPMDQALRNDPDYQELVRALKKQAPQERDRFNEWAEAEQRKEGKLDGSEDA
jgi:hypothetical protein